MASDRKEVLLPPESNAARLWSAKRRAILLIGLVAGLMLFFLWLPNGARAAMFTALRANGPMVAMLVIFSLITISLLWSAGHSLDTRIFLLFNIRGCHPKWLDRAMWLATQAGNMATAIILAAIFFVIKYRRLTVEIILGTLTLWLAVEVIKALTDRARPFMDHEKARVIGWRERGRSFPSGHTAQAFFLAMLISHWFHPGIGGITSLYAAAVLVGFTRMYVGAHYPRDVIGGAVLGSVWGILATLVDPYWFGRF
jgi:membrane-associated phospholipid phosphatase